MTEVKTDALAKNSDGKKELNQSERFTQMIMKQFGNQAGGVVLTEFQKKLCRSYFIKIDQTLKLNTIKESAKTEKYRESLPYKWESVNMEQLAIDVVNYSALGLDPLLPNQINCIPYKNKHTNKFDIGFIKGYDGLKIIARKYGLDCPDDIIVELIYSNDKFKQLKRDANNKTDAYIFEIPNPLDRGTVTGGFYYHVFFSKPEKNKLEVFSKKDIDKRKPKYASAEFWGGQKDKWEKGDDGRSQKTGTEEVEGWYDEMAWKTVCRAAYNDITIDSQKIDENYIAMLQRDSEIRELQTEIKEEAITIHIKENANVTELSLQEKKPEGKKDEGAPTPPVKEAADDKLPEDDENTIVLALSDCKNANQVKKVEEAYPDYHGNANFQVLIANAKKRFAEGNKKATAGGPGF